MAQGDAVRALKIVSRRKGWDPDVIEGSGENISNFDAPPKVFKNQAGTGKLPPVKSEKELKDPGSDVPWNRPSKK